nr:hypothetical protein [uncultured Campylobacter sp.]
MERRSGAFAEVLRQLFKPWCRKANRSFCVRRWAAQGSLGKNRPLGTSL